MSSSLWAVNSNATVVYNRLKNTTGVDQATLNMCMGEALTWKAFAYFFLVRTFGEVPIMHDISSAPSETTATTMYTRPRRRISTIILS